MLARRLLIAGGGGSFTVPPDVVTAFGAAGGWNSANDPKAYTHNGVTYFVYVNDTGDAFINTYTHATSTLGTPFTLRTGLSSASGNIHNSIAVLVRQSDQRLVTVSLQERDTATKVRISTNPEDHTAWGAAATLTTGDSTYSSLAQLSSESGKLYWFTNHYTGSVFYLSYYTSTDGGATWGARVDLVSAVTTSVTYHRIGTTWAGRIDVFVTSTDRALATPSSVYHFYISGGLYYKTDGTQITAALPFAASAATLVQDTTYGSAQPMGWAYDSLGRPATIIDSRPVDATPNEAVRIARWNGSAWNTYPIATSTGQLISASAVVKNNPNCVYFSRLTGSALEMYTYVSADQGVTWDAGTPLTSDGTIDTDGPDTPVNATKVKALWQYNPSPSTGLGGSVKGLVAP